MATLVPLGTVATAFSAGEFTVAAGAEKVLFIINGTTNTPAPASVEFEIAYKVGANDYQVFDTLTSANISGKARYPAGSYAVRRKDPGVSAGMNVEG